MTIAELTIIYHIFRIMQIGNQSTLDAERGRVRTEIVIFSRKIAPSVKRQHAYVHCTEPEKRSAQQFDR